jgi:hypothetical protein
MPALICLGSVVTLAGIVFAVKYLTLPIYRSYIDKKIRKHKDEDKS